MAAKKKTFSELYYDVIEPDESQEQERFTLEQPIPSYFKVVDSFTTSDTTSDFTKNNMELTGAELERRSQRDQ